MGSGKPLSANWDSGKHCRALVRRTIGPQVLKRPTCCGELGADNLECISDLLLSLAEDDHIVQDVQDGQHGACTGTCAVAWQVIPRSKITQTCICSVMRATKCMWQVGWGGQRHSERLSAPASSCRMQWRDKGLDAWPGAFTGQLDTDALPLWQSFSHTQSPACDHLGALQAHANAAVSAFRNVLAALAMDASLLCEFVPAQRACKSCLQPRDSILPEAVGTWQLDH